MKKDMRKITTRIISLLFAALILVADVAALKIDAFAEFKPEVREGTVVIYTEVQASTGEGIGGSGTGFFVGKEGENPEYIITNYHVVSYYVEYGMGKMVTDDNGIQYQAAVVAFFSENDYEKVDVVSYNETKDIAILKLKKPTSKRHSLPLCKPTEEMIGSQVYVVGYPGNAENMFSDKSRWSAKDASVASGTISRYVADATHGVERIQTDAVIQHGNSGGPMVTDEGYVIGINTNVLSNSPYENQIESDYYAIKIDEVIPLLDKNNIDYELRKPGSGKKGNEINLFVIIAIGAGVIVIGSLVTGIMVSKSKKKNKADFEAATAAAVSAVAAANAKKVFIRSLAAQHSGNKIELGLAPIYIGRDKNRCAIVFFENTPGVSGCHCSVSYDMSTGDFIVTDLNSTYGTFLMNDQKLEPNVPYRMKPGTSIYIGDKSNVLCMEVE